VIFDEAHDVEDVAGQYFGASVSNYHFEELVRDVTAVSTRKEFRIAGVRPRPDDARRLCRQVSGIV